eukprot:8945369-Heterocapsa_arctica.AAC.1
MVIARMPEDRSKTFKSLQTHSNTLKAIYTCTCTPVRPTDINPVYPGYPIYPTFTLLCDPFTLLNDPLDRSRSKCRCAFD